MASYTANKWAGGGAIVYAQLEQDEDLRHAAYRKPTDDQVKAYRVRKRIEEMKDERDIFGEDLW